MRRFIPLAPLFLAALLAAALLFTAPVAARPQSQLDTPYEFPTITLDLTPYAMPTQQQPTAYIEPGQPNPSSTLSSQITRIPGQSPTPGTPAPISTQGGTPTFSPQTTGTAGTSAATSTPGRNLFGTEDAEMAAARVTPPPSETPQPSPSPSASATPSLSPTEDVEFTINRAWFVAGVFLPPLLLLALWLLKRLRSSGEFR